MALPVAAAAPDDGALVSVMKAVRADKWDEARRLARPAGQVALDIVEWRRLRAGEGTFDEARDFLRRNPGWPGLKRVRAKTEGMIASTADPQAVIDFFDGQSPVTGYGAVRLTQAFAALGRTGDAEAQAVLTWRTLLLSANGHADLLTDFGPLLAPHHTARLDALLWQGADAPARLMLPLVPEGWRTLAVARMSLRGQGPGVDALIAAVPPALAEDPGLAFERFLWRIRKGRTDDALALMDERSISGATLGQPDRWADWRGNFARQMLRDGKVEQAYRLAANHFLSDGANYADLEWLAGFISLRFLDEPQVALAHFLRLQDSVETPISLSRAGYWQGRAYEAMGLAGEAQAAYARAGRHQTAFYGQLAAEKAGLTMDLSLTGSEIYPDVATGQFSGSSALQAADLLMAADERSLAQWFLTHLAETADAAGQAQLAGFALARDDAHIALRIAKTAAGTGTILPRAYFPVTALAEQSHPVPTELVLSIARRESEFNPVVTSGAGARGLMQLMPGTARSMAEALEISYSGDALLSDPLYNARLGAAYLNRLIDEFGPNYVLVAAGYNAGPGRPRSWIAERGDPRSAGVDVVDWIEMIPFNETRNYVMRVLESVTIYRARLSGEPQPLRLSKELKGY